MPRIVEKGERTSTRTLLWTGPDPAAPPLPGIQDPVVRLPLRDAGGDERARQGDGLEGDAHHRIQGPRLRGRSRQGAALRRASRDFMPEFPVAQGIP